MKILALILVTLGAPTMIDDDDFVDAPATVDPLYAADQLEYFAARREARFQALDARARFTRVAPPSVLSGSLGNQSDIILTTQNKIVVPNGTNVTANANLEVNLWRAPEVQVAEWKGDDSETLPVTVTVFPVQRPNTRNIILTAPVRPYARIQYGTYGSLASFLVDVATGCQFTVNASQVTITAGLETSQTSSPPSGSNVLANQIIAGMLSFHPTTHTPRITKTLYGASSSKSVTYRLPVPNFARDLQFWHDGGANRDHAFLLEFLDSTGAVIYFLTHAAGFFDYNNIPLSDDIAQIQLTRTDNVSEAGKERFIFGIGV